MTDLFGGQVAGALTFIPEARVDGFDNNAEGRSVSNTLALQYYSAAEKLATAATANLAALLPCDPAARGEAVCLDQFLDGFGKRAWRRPLEPRGAGWAEADVHAGPAGDRSPTASPRSSR